MADQFSDDFRIYQEAVKNIGLQSDVSEFEPKEEKQGAADDIAKFAAAVTRSEKKLSKVMSFCKAYREILKMVE